MRKRNVCRVAQSRLNSCALKGHHRQHPVTISCKFGWPKCCCIHYSICMQNNTHTFFDFNAVHTHMASLGGELLEQIQTSIKILKARSRRTARPGHTKGTASTQVSQSAQPDTEVDRSASCESLWSFVCQADELGGRDCFASLARSGVLVRVRGTEAANDFEDCESKLGVGSNIIDAQLGASAISATTPWIRRRTNFLELKRKKTKL